MSKIKFTLSAIAFTLASGAAMAQEAVPAQWNSAYTPDVSVHTGQKAMASSAATASSTATAKPLTRAEVRAEFLAARRSGESNPFDADPYVNVSAHATPAASHTQVATR